MKKKSDKLNQPSLQDLNHKISDLESKWKRALADYQNLEKRIASQQTDFVKFANAALIEKLLQVVDDLERALNHTQDKGLEMIVSQFKDILTTEGVEEIAAQNQSFDPNKMEAVDMVAGKQNQVIKVIAKGYMLNHKVLRPAKVQVGKGGNHE